MRYGPSSLWERLRDSPEATPRFTRYGDTAYWRGMASGRARGANRTSLRALGSALRAHVTKTVVFDTWKVARLDLRTCRRRNRWMCGEGLCSPWRGRAVEPASNEHRAGAIALLQSRNAQMIHHMGHGAPPRVMAPQPIRGPDPRASYATPSAGNRTIRRYGLAEHLARADRALRPPELPTLLKEGVRRSDASPALQRPG